MRNVCKSVSSRTTDLFVLQSLLEWLCSQSLSRHHYPTVFSQSLSSQLFCSSVEIFSTTNNLSNFWHSKLQQASTYAFCIYDDIFMQKWNCSSPNNLCKCTESSSALSTNTFIEWNLSFSWSNHVVTSFTLKMNVGGFSEHQNETSDTDRYKRYFFTARVSQVKMNTMKKILSSGLNCRLLVVC